MACRRVSSVPVIVDKGVHSMLLEHSRKMTEVEIDCSRPTMGQYNAGRLSCALSLEEFPSKGHALRADGKTGR